MWDFSDIDFNFNRGCFNLIVVVQNHVILCENLANLDVIVDRGRY